MRGINSVFVRVLMGAAIASGLLWVNRTLSQQRQATVPRTVQISQTWELQPGDEVGGYRVTGGLGDISVDLGGKWVRAPFSGTAYAYTPECLLFSSAEVPAYLFRFCGLKRVRLGDRKAGDALGTGEQVHFAALRKQPDGTWAMIEPAKQVLERSLP